MKWENYERRLRVPSGGRSKFSQRAIVMRYAPLVPTTAALPSQAAAPDAVPVPRTERSALL